MVFFLYLSFLMVVADNASLSMCAWELPYMTFYGHKPLVFAGPVYRTGNIHRTELD